MSGRCCIYFLPNTETGCFGRDKQRSPGAGSQMNPTKSKAFCGYSTLGIVVWETTEHCVLYQKKKLLNDYVRFIPLNPVVFKVVGLNSLVVRQFGFRFHCNGIKQLAKDFLKACRPVCHGTLPFPPFPLHHALSAPTVHLNGYRLILLIWHLARSGHCLWPTTESNIPTLFGKQQVRGKQRTGFLTTGQKNLSYTIFSLVLHSAHSRLVQTAYSFPYIGAGKVNLQHFTSRCSIRQVAENLPCNVLFS